MDNRSFWNNRYRTFPRVGSGPGSRGYAARKKNLLIRQVIAEFQVQTILDIGCGDMCWMDEEIAAVCQYQGYDIAEVIVARNRIAYPALEFAIHDIVTSPIGRIGDLVVCFDLLIHQIDEAGFRAALTHTLAAIGRVGLLSYLAPPLPDGSFPPPEEPHALNADSLMLMREAQYQEILKEMRTRKILPVPTADTAFHGVLANRIAELHPDLEVSTAGSYRNHTVYSVKRQLVY
jgi:hypothetical protein